MNLIWLPFEVDLWSFLRAGSNISHWYMRAAVSLGLTEVVVCPVWKPRNSSSKTPGPWDGNKPNNMNTNVSVSIFDFSLQITNSRALAHTYYIYILYSKMSWKTTFQFVFSIYPSSKRNINDLFTISHNITAGSQHSSLPWQAGSLSPLRVLFFLGDT